MVKGISNLGSLRKVKAQELKQKQLLNQETKLTKLCQKVAKESGIQKPINYTVNNKTTFSYKDIGQPSDHSELAPWSSIHQIRKTINPYLKASKLDVKG